MDALTTSVSPVTLAHEHHFQLGPLEVRPATCEITGEVCSVILEPRVMQVLVALHHAGGHVVSRDDLLQRCWSGRIVGDDAIHRVISRLRHDGERLGGYFRIETITKVGYRLVVAGTPKKAQARTFAPNASQSSISRRAIVGGAGGLAVLTAAGLGIERWRKPPMPEEARRKLEEGLDLWRLGTLDSFAAAQSAFRVATALAPDHAEPVACLALSYAYQSDIGEPSKSAEAERNAHLLAARALSIDPDVPEAMIARVAMGHRRRTTPLAVTGRQIDDVLKRSPDHYAVRNMHTFFLSQVGRLSDALRSFDEWVKFEPELPPIPGSARGYALFTVGRVDEADQVLAQLLERWPRHVSTWFTTLKTLMFSGRYDRALAMLDDGSRRPVGIPMWNFDLARAQIRALAEPQRYADAAAQLTFDAAKRGTGFAENGILYFSAQGLIDQAFTLVDALFLDRGFKVSPQRFTAEQGHFDNRRRRTLVLFERTTAPLRRDPRFLRITDRIGLEAYWRATGSTPDFRSSRLA